MNCWPPRPRAGGGWILRDRLVISFADLTEEPLRVLCAGDVERHDTTEWAASDDTDTQHRFMDLLSRALAEDHWGDLRWHNDRQHLHFCPTDSMGPRREGRVPGRRGHTVFGPYYSKNEPDTVSFYRHAALTTRFRRIGGTWYCQLSTDYCFTSDGRAEYRYADTLLAGIKRLDRHAAVAGWTRTWATYLTQPPDLFAKEMTLIFGDLKTFDVDRGIEDRLWGPAPIQHRDDDADDTAENSRVEAALAAMGIETGDLFAFDDDGPDVEEPSTTTDGSTAPAKPLPRNRRGTATTRAAGRRKGGS